MQRNEMLEKFRERLGTLLAEAGLSRSEFARRAGMDRSTLSQLLSSDSTRLPRAETIASLAEAAQVSIDWLLGLSQTGQIAADVLPEASAADMVGIEARAGSPSDERLRRWHAEAVGYKIRYVPTTVPDLLKTEAVIRYEYRGAQSVAPQLRIEEAEARLAYTRRPETDMEVCSSVQLLESFARGEGVWRDLDAAVRRDALLTMRRRVLELYPTFRWFLFDGRAHFSVPLTVFGPLRAAIYIGEKYLVLNATEHVRVLTQHFDDLIRSATVQPTEIAARIEALLPRMGG